ncbi:OmpA family protein [Luteibacter sp.]|uniref:OmpA family protein n=1 Tax=Luteibacter sp. TaxID=1886636 RepID=UPI002807AE1B|nr:OmpA family protein [Luteibacter sp.]MDQ8050858.1 OmpA family protein [Luteibacter sp.]
MAALLLSTALCASAFAQVSDTARIATPAGITDSNPANNTSTVVTPLAGTVASSKSANPVSGSTVAVGQTIEYTLTTTVSGAPLANPVTLSDALGAGLAFDSVTSAGSFSCSGTGPVNCALPAGTAPGSYSVTYAVTVTQAATTSVSNTVTPSEGTCTVCSTTHPLVTVTTSKTSDVGNGTAVQRGATIVYTVTTQVSGAGALTSPLLLTDTLSSGLTFGSIVSAGSFSCAAGNPVHCTLPAGTGAGSYAVSYSAVVNEAAVTSVANTVVPDQGTCITCTTTNPVVDIATSKTSDVGDGTQVSVGSTISYTLTSTVTGGPLSQPLTLTDTLGAGLTFAAVTSPGNFTCNATNPVVCTLPAGTPAGSHSVTYSATVNATATVAAENSVFPSDGECVDCTTINPLVAVLTQKSSDIGTGTGVQAGDTIVYTLTSFISGAGTLATPLVLTDTLSPGLAFGSITNPGSFSCTGTNPVVCTLPAGTPAGTYPVSYSAVVQASATTSVSNTVVPNQGGCIDCTTTNPLLTLSTSKTSDVGNGTAVQRGQRITYTVTTVISGAGALSQVFTLSDTLGPGLTLDAITAPGAFNCAVGNPVVCSLPVGTAAGTYPVSYTALVLENATTSVSNTVTPSDGTCTTCTTVNPLVEIATTKTSDAGAGTPVARGQTITYTLTSTVTGGALARPLTLTDTFGPGLALGAVTAPGSFTCNSATPLVCTLPAGTAAGAYPVSYTVTVGADATNSVHNSVVPSDGTCDVCRIDNPLTDPLVTYSKAVVLPAGQTEVRSGDTLTYNLTATVAVAPTTDIVTLTDAVGSGLQFASVTSTTGFTCGAAMPLICTLPAGTALGTYTVSYTAQVTPSASGSVRNAVVGTGGDNPTCTASCNTETPVLTPAVNVNKSADPSSGAQVERGGVLRYTLTVVVTNAALTSPLVLTDTPDPGLTIGTLPPQCSPNGTLVVCTLPAGTAVGSYNLSYDATVNAQAGSVVNNTVSPSGGSSVPPTCGNCSTTHRVDDPLLRIVKTAGVREVRIGDLVPYTLSIANVSSVDLIDGSIVDTTPAGFSLVSGSLRQSGGDPLTVSGAGPVLLGGLNLPAGGLINVTYLMRVGAGVRAGTHVNQAQASSSTGTPISNIATAQVVLGSDPLLDESLIFGTVFDDRDGDGWQDRADLTEVRVQGGFAEADYIANSTTVQRDGAEQPQLDASAPMAHGLALGSIAARGSNADPAELHQVVVRQRLRQARFTDDFVLTSAQGVTVRMDAQGATHVERSGEAGKGLNAAAPDVERVVSESAGGVTVDYVVRNQGVDERGIPGVRIASVEGLLMETDQFGRYHLVGIEGGAWGRGRNFVLKVDPVTLPPGSTFTTDNPLLRRITPGVPVRFDWGVHLPEAAIEAGTQAVEAVLGKVMFAPGGSSIAPKHLPAVERMVAQLRGRHGEVVVEAEGDTPELAFARAKALQDALQSRLSPAELDALRISVREKATDPSTMVAGIGTGNTLLGTLLFDNDKATIRPRYRQLLDQIAADLEHHGGGTVAIVGYTDVHGSHAYNAELGLRRARAAYDAIAARLSPELRGRVKVESNADTRAPVDVPPPREARP